MITDEESMWQVQANADQWAFARLVKRWKKPIERLCAQMTGDRHLAEDLCQEAFTKVFTHRQQYRPAARFSTWLWRIALNLCYTKLRRRQFQLDRRGNPSGVESTAACEAVSEQPSPDERLLAWEEAELVQNALLGLPPSLRSIIILRYWEGMKLCEAAKQLQISPTTAASRCATALARLTRVLEKDFEQ